MRSNKGEKYVFVADKVQYTCMMALFVREPLKSSVSATVGPSVDLATGFNLMKDCSRRGSVSLNFRAQDSSFLVINMFIKPDSLALKLQDLRKVLYAH